MHSNVEHWGIHKRATCHASGMVASQHHLATAAGSHILNLGGNAVDAAIASALALGVVEPWMCGLGGSGLMVVWLAEEKRAVALDFQGKLADASSCADYTIDPDLPETLMGFPTVQDRANVEGYRSITVPGAAAGFDHALQRWGTMSLAKVAQPAIEMARSGLICDWFTTLQSALMAEVLKQDPNSSRIYLPNDVPLQPEQLWHIPQLAETLQAYAQRGAESFYHGEVARSMVRDLQAGGSDITEQDFAAYEVIEAPAEEIEVQGTRVHTLGDVSGGTRLRTFLAEVAHKLPANSHSGSPATWEIYADAMNLAWREHKRRIGRETEHGSCTSHLSTADASGNMVALTHTLLNRFGSGVTLPDTGLLMNNAVSYFDPREGYPTSIAASARINASNMCPAIVSRDKTAVLAVGASGGNHIMPAVAQIVALMLNFNLSLEEAMNHPRIDASDRGSIRVDPRFDDAIIRALGKKHTLEIAQRLVFPKLYACQSAVAYANKSFFGLNDPSQPIGSAAGPAAFEWRAPAGQGQIVRA